MREPGRHNPENPPQSEAGRQTGECDLTFEAPATKLNLHVAAEAGLPCASSCLQRVRKYTLLPAIRRRASQSQRHRSRGLEQRLCP